MHNRYLLLIVAMHFNQLYLHYLQSTDTIQYLHYMQYRIYITEISNCSHDCLIFLVIISVHTFTVHYKFVSTLLVFTCTFPDIHRVMYWTTESPRNRNVKSRAEQKICRQALA